MLPHEIVTPLKEGDKVKKGDIVTYNSHYFELDPLDPKQALWKAGALVKTAILESADTLEDSSALSEAAAKRLSTQITKVRDIVVEFGQSVRNLLNVGSEVGAESILCTIEDEVSAQNQLFDDDALDTLKLLSANNPKAKIKGVVEKIEVFYNGELDDLSPSLQDLAQASNRERKREARALGTTYTPGQVDDSLRVNGNSLPNGHALIRVYITADVPSNIGDKFVFGNQMKTVVGRILPGINETESGVPIDAVFGWTSIADRITLSPPLIATTNTLLKVVSKKVADVYFNG